MKPFGLAPAKAASDDQLLDGMAAAYDRGGEDDAYDFFARGVANAQKKKLTRAAESKILTLLICACIALALGAAACFFAPSTMWWTVAMCFTAAVLAAIAVILGSYASTE